MLLEAKLMEESSSYDSNVVLRKYKEVFYNIFTLFFKYNIEFINFAQHTHKQKLIHFQNITVAC